MDSYPTRQGRWANPATARGTLRRMASPIKASPFNDVQREAVAVAFLDRRIRPAQAVADLAARGELPGPDGEPLEPFEVKADNVRTWAARLRRGRAGKLKSGLTDAAPKDAIEALRQRLVSAADDALRRTERRLRAPSCNAKDIEQARQIARLIREAAAIPGPNDARPVPPGAKVPGAGGKSNGDRTQGGLAGQILSSHRGGPVYTPDDPPRQGANTEAGHTENSSPSAGGNHGPSRTTTEGQEDSTDEGPGSWAREQVARLGA